MHRLIFKAFTIDRSHKAYTRIVNGVTQFIKQKGVPKAEEQASTDPTKVELEDDGMIVKKEPEKKEGYGWYVNSKGEFKLLQKDVAEPLVASGELYVSDVKEVSRDYLAILRAMQADIYEGEGNGKALRSQLAVLGLSSQIIGQLSAYLVQNPEANMQDACISMMGGPGDRAETLFNTLTNKDMLREYATSAERKLKERKKTAEQMYDFVNSPSIQKLSDLNLSDEEFSIVALAALNDAGLIVRLDADDASLFDSYKYDLLSSTFGNSFINSLKVREMEKRCEGQLGANPDSPNIALRNMLLNNDNPNYKRLGGVLSMLMTTPFLPVTSMGAIITDYWQNKQEIRDRLNNIIGDGMAPGILRSIMRSDVNLDDLLKAGSGKIKDLASAAAIRERLEIDASYAAQNVEDWKISDAVIEGLRKSVGNDNADLFKFQKQAVAWVETQKRGLLCYGTGTGKTPIAIAALTNLMEKGEIKRGVIVLPPTLISQWPTEIDKFRPGSDIVVIGDSQGADADIDNNEKSLAMLKAINDGKVKADFVIVSSELFDEDLGKEEHYGEYIETFADFDQLRGEELLAVIDRVRSSYQKDMTLDKKMLLRYLNGDAKVRQSVKDQLNRQIQKNDTAKELAKLDGGYIFDEVHLRGIKTATTDRNKTVRRVLKDKKYAIGMTATPITANAEDLWHLTETFAPGTMQRIASGPTQFAQMMVKTDFVRDAEGNIIYDAEGNTQTQEVARTPEETRPLKERIRHAVFFKLKIEGDVVQQMDAAGQKLPAMHAISQSIHMSSDLQDMYSSVTVPFKDSYDINGVRMPVVRNEWENNQEPLLSDQEFYNSLMSGNDNRMGVSEKYVRMAMASRAQTRGTKMLISPKLIFGDAYEGEQPKLDAAIATVQQHFSDLSNENRPVIIFGHYKDSLALAKAEMIKKGIPESAIVSITGDDARDDRTISKIATNAGKSKVLLISIEAGGAGLNLQGMKDKKTGEKTGAYRAIFLDKPWTPSSVEQSIARIYRTGHPDADVYVHHLKTPEIDKAIWDKHHRDIRRDKYIDATSVGTSDYIKAQRIQTRANIMSTFALADKDPGVIDGQMKAVLDGVNGILMETSATPEEAVADYAQLSGLPPQYVHTVFTDIMGRADFSKADLAKQVKYEDYIKNEFNRLRNDKYADDALLALGKLTKEKHALRAKKRVNNMKKWAAEARAEADHPVYTFMGDMEINWQTPGQSEISNDKPSIKIKKPKKTAESVEPTLGFIKPKKVLAPKEPRPVVEPPKEVVSEPKKPRGRPRKAASEEPKRPRGRPRVFSEPAEKKPRGRPKKSAPAKDFSWKKQENKYGPKHVKKHPEDWVIGSIIDALNTKPPKNHDHAIKVLSTYLLQNFGPVVDGYDEPEFCAAAAEILIDQSYDLLVEEGYLVHDSVVAGGRIG